MFQSLDTTMSCWQLLLILISLLLYVKHVLWFLEFLSAVHQTHVHQLSHNMAACSIRVV